MYFYKLVPLGEESQLKPGLNVTTEINIDPIVVQNNNQYEHKIGFTFYNLTGIINYLNRYIVNDSSFRGEYYLYTVKLPFDDIDLKFQKGIFSDGIFISNKIILDDCCILSNFIMMYYIHPELLEDKNIVKYSIIKSIKTLFRDYIEETINDIYKKLNSLTLTSINYKTTIKDIDNELNIFNLCAISGNIDILLNYDDSLNCLHNYDLLNMMIKSSIKYNNLNIIQFLHHEKKYITSFKQCDLHDAIKYKHIILVDYLVKQPEIEITDYEIYLAAQYDFNIAKFLYNIQKD